MYSCNDTLAGGLPHSDIHGSTPARGSPWLFAACHVLHRLLVPRHPPNALLILDIFDVAPKSRVHHAQKPSSELSCQGSVVSCQKQLQPDPRLFEDSPGNIYSAHNRILSNRSSAARLRDHREKFDKIVHNASEPSPPDRWGAILTDSNSRSDNSVERRTSSQGSAVRDQNRIDRPNPCTNTC